MEEEKRGPGRPPKKQTVAMEMLRDRWDEEGTRIRKGTIVDMDPVEALDMQEQGLVRRIK